MKITIGTRGSKLALWQTHYIRDLLLAKNPNIEVDIKIIATKGDKVQNVPLPQIGGKGLFTEEIERQLLQNKIQLAVHSLKDLPSQLPQGLIYAGSPGRATVCDAFISLKHKALKEVPATGVIATGSLRRQTQVQQLLPQVNFCDLRGNIGTRLQKLQDNNWDGIIMAAAALERLELKHQITEYLPAQSFIPAVGQGAIGLEVNENQQEIIKLIGTICDQKTCDEVAAERAFMEHLGGGCSIPLGAWGRIEKETLLLDAFVSHPQGTSQIRESISGPFKEGINLGKTLAERFLSLGARKLLNK